MIHPCLRPPARAWRFLKVHIGTSLKAGYHRVWWHLGPGPAASVGELDTVRGHCETNRQRRSHGRDQHAVRRFKSRHPNVVILYNRPLSSGWHPITYMVNLAAELFDADLVTQTLRHQDMSSTLRKLSCFRRPRGIEPCLFICRTPMDLNMVSTIVQWYRRFNRIVVWVIDSFLHETIPWIARLARPYDAFFVTHLEDMQPWTRATRRPVQWLPWGADVLRLGSDNPQRSCDLLRVGRQPASWNDDRRTESLFRDASIRFRGRPPFFDHAGEAQSQLMKHYADTRFTLAFSNSVDSRPYTHQTRQYITGRWSDALASRGHGGRRGASLRDRHGTAVALSDARTAVHRYHGGHNHGQGRRGKMATATGTSQPCPGVTAP